MKVIQTCSPKIHLFAAVAVAIVLVCSSGSVLAQEGRTYEVTMTRIPPNPQMPPVEFCTCMRFSDEAPGTLILDHFPWALVWVHTENDPESDTWESLVGAIGTNRAVPGPHTPGFGFFTIAHHGEVLLDETIIQGDGVAELGAAFSFEGFENPDCSLALCPSIP